MGRAARARVHLPSSSASTLQLLATPAAPWLPERCSGERRIQGSRLSLCIWRCRAAIIGIKLRIVLVPIFFLVQFFLWGRCEVLGVAQQAAEVHNCRGPSFLVVQGIDVLGREAGWTALVKEQQLLRC